MEAIEGRKYIGMKKGSWTSEQCNVNGKGGEKPGTIERKRRI